MSDIDPEDARRTADEILSRPEFREQAPDLLERVLDRLFSGLQGFAGSVFSAGSLWIGYLILGVAVALAVWFLWRHLPRSGPVSAGRRVNVERETLARRSRAEWLSKAARAEAEQAWDEAVHARYHAMTSGLAETEELPADESATSGEHLRAFSAAADSHPARVVEFEQATDRYEHIWFGGEQALADDVDAMVGADRKVLEPPA